MYGCLRCGTIFGEPCRIRESHWPPDGMAEEYVCCPYCGSADFREVTEDGRCGVCGEYTTKRADRDHNICSQCADAAMERFRFFLLNEFTDAEREHIDYAIEGVSLDEILQAKEAAENDV